MAVYTMYLIDASWIAFDGDGLQRRNLSLSMNVSRIPVLKLKLNQNRIFEPLVLGSFFFLSSVGGISKVNLLNSLAFLILNDKDCSSIAEIISIRKILSS